MDGDMIGITVIGGIFALLLLRSAVIVFWPGSGFALRCESTFDFIDDGPSMSDGSDAGDGGDGGD